MPIYPREFIDSFVSGGARSNCFVLMPFSASFDDVYESIHNACESAAVLLSCSRADDFYRPGHIMEDILTGIMTSEYIVADLTGKNPNVFYELGIAHATKAPSKVVIISQTIEDVPSDLRQVRCIVYRNDPAGLRSLSKKLERAFLADAKDLYRFVADEKRSLEFGERLSGENRNFYTFTMDDLLVGPDQAKFVITVRRESLVEGNATLEPGAYYVRAGECVPIRPTDWEIRLDRTEQKRAVFAVQRIQAQTDDAADHPGGPTSGSSNAASS